MKTALIILCVLAIFAIPIPISVKYPTKKKTEDKKPQKSPDSSNKEKKKLLKDIPWVSLLKKVVPKIPKPIKYLIRHTSIAKVSLEMVVAGEDASETAIKFGTINAAVYSILGLLQNIIEIKPKKIIISPDFCGGKSKIDFSAKIRIVPLCVIISIIPIIFAVISAFIQVKKEKK